MRTMKAADRTPRPPRDQGGGFTLIELLVVLVILSLVMGLVAPRVLGYLSKSRVKATVLQIQSMKAALDLFYLDNGRYPSRTEGLSALVKAPAGADHWGGPYIQQTQVPADPWGNPYIYQVPGSKTPFDIVSTGADGQAGGTGDNADITSN